MINNTMLYKSASGHKIIMDAYDQGLREWPVPHDSLYVFTRHGETHVIVAGCEDAPPLIFFHGWNGSAVGTRDELDLPSIVQHFRLYAPDTIGQSGRSAPNRPSVQTDAYGEWMVDLLDSLNIKQAYVAGISGGGYLALKLAAFAPDRAIKVFAISTAGITSLAVPGLGFLLATIPAFIHPAPTTARLFVRRVSAPNIPFTDAHERMAQGMVLLFRHYRMLGSPGYLTDAELQRITAPVSVLMGAHDSTISATRTVQRANHLIRTVETEIIPDAGHTLPIDQPHIVMNRLMQFFLGKEV